MHMKQLKVKVDEYFDLEGDISGQCLYYGTLGFMFAVMFFGTIANLAL